MSISRLGDWCETQNSTFQPLRHLLVLSCCGWLGRHHSGNMKQHHLFLWKDIRYFKSCNSTDRTILIIHTIRSQVTLDSREHVPTALLTSVHLLGCQPLTQPFVSLLLLLSSSSPPLCSLPTSSIHDTALEYMRQQCCQLLTARGNLKFQKLPPKWLDATASNNGHDQNVH